MKKLFTKVLGLKQSAKKGFTLIELVVAIAIMLIIGGVATPMLLSHLNDAKVANLNEVMLNTKTAFDSYFAKNEGVLATPGVGQSQFDLLVADGFMGSIPKTDGVTWTIETNSDANGAGTAGTPIAYYLKGVVATAKGPSFMPRISDLDSRLDGADGNAAGSLQFVNDATEGAEKFEIYYLLHADPGSTAFHG